MKYQGALPDIRIPAGNPPLISSLSLFGSGREVIIAHGDERYRLRITASNKLILIK